MSGEQPKHHRRDGFLWSLVAHGAMLGLLLASVFFRGSEPVRQEALGLVEAPPPAADEPGKPVPPPVQIPVVKVPETPPAELPPLPEPPPVIKDNPPGNDIEEGDPNSKLPVVVRPKPPAKPPKKPPVAKPEDTLAGRINHGRVVPATIAKPPVIGKLPPVIGNNGNNGNNGNAGSSGNAGNSGKPTGSAEAAYDQLLGSLCKQLWSEPSLSELNNQRPIVTISVTIGCNGRILDSVVSQPSKNAAMDNSVRRVCDQLRTRQLPPFVDFKIAGTVMTKEIDLQIK